MAKICFIVGHGKSKNGKYDSGAVFGSYHEFEIAKEIAKYAYEYYNNTYNEQCDLMNYGGDLYLTDRIEKVNDNDYDFIAEFHLNAGGGTGTECFYYHGSKTGQKYADQICKKIASTMGVEQRRNSTSDYDGGDKVRLNDRGKDYFAIVRDTKPCAVLIETVFIDTESDLNKVKTAAGQKKCGESIAKAVASVRGVSKKTASKVENNADDVSAFNVGDIVSIGASATYYGSKTPVPNWVKDKKWIVKDVSGNRVVLDKSEDGSNSICSAIHGKFLTAAIKPYTVKVTTDALNIRRGPGVDYSIIGCIVDKGVYTIIEEKDGWGKLKSKTGWISLKYTKKR